MLDAEELDELGDTLRDIAAESGLEWVVDEVETTFAARPFQVDTDRIALRAIRVHMTLDALETAVALVVDLRGEIRVAENELTSGKVWRASSLGADAAALVPRDDGHQDLALFQRAVEALRRDLVEETDIDWIPDPSGSGREAPIATIENDADETERDDETEFK